MDNASEQFSPDRKKNLEQMGMEGLLAALTSEDDVYLRRHAAYLLGRAGDPSVVPFLIRALSDTDKEVREQAMLALSAIGQAAIEPLKKAMEDPKWETRYRAVEALGKIADERVVSPLIKALNDERDHVRYMAAKGLRETGNSQSIDPLIALLRDENEFVRMMAAKGLGVIGGERIHAALEQALMNEKNERVKAAITEAMN